MGHVIASSTAFKLRALHHLVPLISLKIGDSLLLLGVSITQHSKLQITNDSTLEDSIMD